MGVDLLIVMALALRMLVVEFDQRKVLQLAQRKMLKVDQKAILVVLLENLKVLLMSGRKEVLEVHLRLFHLVFVQKLKLVRVVRTKALEAHLLLAEMLCRQVFDPTLKVQVVVVLVCLRMKMQV